MNIAKPLFLSLLLLFAASNVLAATDPKAEAIRSSLAVFLPNLAADSVRATPLPGLYEVSFGTRLFYVSEDGRYLVQGSIFDLETQQDLTKPRLSAIRHKVIEGIGEENMLIYEPKQTKYQVTVFTDIDCPYCRKMHGQMAAYLDLGIRFRYLLYPRAGKGSPSYDKAVSVWCAEDRHKAMDQAKGGAAMPKRDCAHPVDMHLDIGGKLPIRGTPAIVLDDGDVLPGYIPPAALFAELEKRRLQQPAKK